MPNTELASSTVPKASTRIEFLSTRSPLPRDVFPLSPPLVYILLMFVQQAFFAGLGKFTWLPPYFLFLILQRLI